METTRMGYTGIIGLYRGNRVIMEKKMKTTIREYYRCY